MIGGGETVPGRFNFRPPLQATAAILARCPNSNFLISAAGFGGLNR